MATLLDNVNTSETLLAEIASADARLTSHFRRVLGVAPELNRQLVSFQANKATPGYRWYKYKEAFSSRLVKHLLRTYHVPAGTVLDPFAGVGTTSSHWHPDYPGQTLRHTQDDTRRSQ